MAGASSKKSIYLSENSDNPYADIVAVNDQLYLSGLVSQDLDSGEVLNGDIEFETETILSNLKRILRSHGSDMEQVVKVDIYINDFSERDRMNEVYLKHFSPGTLPARICVGGVDLACNCKVEMGVTALRRGFD